MEAWERAGDGVRAARLVEAAGDGLAEGHGQGAARAARILESALRRDPERADLMVALGDLLLRYGKASGALRALQRVPEGAPEKPEALRLSLRALDALGMADAKADVAAVLASTEPPTTSTTSATHEAAAVTSAAPTNAPIKARLYGRYEVVREISSTATARVVECVDTLRGERVAVKIFSAQATATRGYGRDALSHFLREARVLAHLAHPSIVRMNEILEQGPALVLEWMPGGTLEQRLAVETMIPARAAVIARAVLSALGEGHRLGVVHRDVKPANILFDAVGTARLSDFGVAHLGDLSVTATAGSFGSLAYMSPEQREGRPATAQSDIFSLGVVLVEMLTGSRPHLHTRADDGTSEHLLARAHRHLGARHERAVAQLLERDPARRPEDAFAAAQALTELPWPESNDGVREPRRDSTAPNGRAPSVRPPPERVVQIDAGEHDSWLERDIVRVLLTRRSLERAALYARTRHPALQSVLRVDRDGGFLWLGAPRGERLARPLLSNELSSLQRALGELHAAGFVHGSVGPEHVLVGAGEPMLLFPDDRDEGTAELDRDALHRLAREPGRAT